MNLFNLIFFLSIFDLIVREIIDTNIQGNFSEKLNRGEKINSHTLTIFYTNSIAEGAQALTCLESDGYFNYIIINSEIIVRIFMPRVCYTNFKSSK